MRLRRHTLRGDAKLSSRGGYARAWYVPVRRFSDQTLRLLDLGLPSKRDDTGKDNKLVGAIAGVSDPSDNQTDLRTAFEDVSLAFAELGKVHAGLKVEHLHQQAVIEATPDAIHVYDVATGSLVRGNRSGKPLIGFTAPMVAVLSGVDVTRWSRRGPTTAGAVVRRRLRARRRRGRSSCGTASTTTAARPVAVAAGHAVRPRRRRGDHRAAGDQPRRHRRRRRRGAARARRPARRADRPGQPAPGPRPTRALAAPDRARRSRRGARLRSGRLQTHQRRVRPPRRRRGADRDRGPDERRDPPGRHGRPNGRRRGRAVDTIARMGGDEFIVILDIPEHDDPAVVAEQVAQRIAAAIAQPFTADGREHRMSVSIGIALAGDTPPPSRCSATPTPRCTTSNPAAGTVTRSSNPATGPTPPAPTNSNATSAARSPTTASRCTTSRSSTRAPTPSTASRRCCGSDDDSGQLLDTAHVIRVAERTGLIGDVDARVLQQACAQAVGLAARPRAGAPDAQGEPQRPRHHPARLLPAHHRRARRQRPRPARPDPRDHRNRAARRQPSRPGRPARLAPARHRTGHRRLRHRLRLAALPRRTPDHLHQDRPELHQPASPTTPPR